MSTEIKDWTFLLANISIILTLFIIIFQANVALKQYKNSIQQNKRDRSLGLISRWNDLEFSKIRREVMMYFKKIKFSNFDDYKDSLEKNSDMRGYAARILNFFEEIAIGVNRGVHDFDIAYTFFHPVVTYYWELLLPFVKWLRQRDHDDSIFKEVEKMYHLFVKKTTENYVIPPGRYWSA